MRAALPAFPTRQRLAVVTALLCVAGCTQERPSASVRASSPAIRASDAGDALTPDTSVVAPSATFTIQQPADELPDGSVLLLNAALVEADTVIVDTLNAISVEAQRIQARDRRVVSFYPTVAEPNLSMLEGNVVRGHSLDAHHVRARVVIADRLRAHTIRIVKPSHGWSADAGGSEVVNGCSAIAERVRPYCGRWLLPGE